MRLSSSAFFAANSSCEIIPRWRRSSSSMSRIANFRPALIREAGGRTCGGRRERWAGAVGIAPAERPRDLGP